MTRHYRNSVTGKYIGGFDGKDAKGDDIAPDVSLNPVLCPASARGDDIWNGSSWTPRVPTPAEIASAKAARANGLSAGDTGSGLLAVAKLIDPTMTERKLSTLIEAEL